MGGILIIFLGLLAFIALVIFTIVMIFAGVYVSFSEANKQAHKNLSKY